MKILSRIVEIVVISLIILSLWAIVLFGYNKTQAAYTGGHGMSGGIDIILDDTIAYEPNPDEQLIRLSIEDPSDGFLIVSGFAVIGDPNAVFEVVECDLCPKPKDDEIVLCSHVVIE